MAAYQNAILEVEVLDKEDGQDNLIDRFMTAIKDRNVFACCLYCYLELDNGFEELADVMAESELPEDATYIKDDIKAYLQDKSRETQGSVYKDLNYSVCVAGTMTTPKTMKILPIFLPKHTRAT